MPAQLPEFRARLLGWYDQNRRKLPWRGDAPAASESSATAAASAASSSANSAFGAREKKAAKAKQQAAASEAQSVARFFVRKPKVESATAPPAEIDAAAATAGSHDATMDPAPAAAASAAAGSASAASSATAASASTAASSSVVAASPLPVPVPVSAYGTWVSEIMLQQTRVETVIDYYTRWMARFPTVQALAAASSDDVQRFWSGLGYYRRARFLHEGAQQLVRDFSGELPRTIEGLRQIKGIGPYTAGAIGSIALNLPVPLVDGNVTRVLCRLRALAMDPKAKSTDSLMWLFAEQVLDRSRPGDFNQALMELGAVVCTPTNPRCGECPVAKLCYARREVDEKQRPCTIRDEERATVPTADAATGTKNEPMDIEDLGSAVAGSPAAASSSDAAAAAASSAAASASKSKKPRAKSASNAASAAAAAFASPSAPCTLCSDASSSDPPAAVTAYPLKASKAAPLEQSVAVCVVKRAGAGTGADAVAGSGTGPDLYLILRRPSAGLLANQWELPSAIVAANASASQRAAAIAHLLATQLCLPAPLLSQLLHQDPAAAPLGELTHLFSHRKHLMRVTEATLDLNPADQSVASRALLQAAAADRIIDSAATAGSTPAAAAAAAVASSASGSKKRNVSGSIAAKNKRRKADETKSKSTLTADDDSATEDEDAEAESDTADIEDDSTALRSYRWVPLSLLQQPHTLQSGSELGLTSAVRKVVKMIGEGGEGRGRGVGGGAGKQSKAKAKLAPAPSSKSTKSKSGGAASVSSASAPASAPSSSSASAAADRCVIELDSDDE